MKERVESTLERKVELIKKHEETKASISKLAENFQIGRTQVILS